MPIEMQPVKYQVVPLRGGWDQVTPTLSLAPGAIRDVLNFECASTGGYTRIGGYERFDGHPRPSAATYTILQTSGFTNTPTAGQTVTQATTLATGYIIYVGTTAVDGSDYMVVTKVTGAFDAFNSFTTPGPVAIGTATNQIVIPSALQDSVYLNLAADAYRTDIGAVPGSGPVRGVFGMTISGTDYVYAFRDNAGGTAVDLYKATTGGWTQINFEYEVSFTVGNAATPADGATLTQGGVTATIRRVVATSGQWTGDAAGKLVISAPAGGNFAAGAATISGGATCTLSGVQTAITMAVGGKFEFAQGNFSGQLSTLRMYGADSVNRCFEFDGTYFVPITTGVSPDTPKHIAVHKNHLIFSVQTSIFYSGAGYPYRFGAIDQGGEIACGDTITNLVVMPGNQNTGTLAVYGRNITFMLYGTGSANWNLVGFNTGTGGLDYTAQNMNDSYVMDDRGVTTLQTTLSFGNFNSASLTAPIRPYILSKRGLVANSCLMREKNQYRLFFTDGYGLYMTIVNGKHLGSCAVNFPNPVYQSWNGSASDGTEVVYFGAASGGYVYQLDKGTSFDGAQIDAFITTAWNAAGSPRILKRWRHASIEMQSNSYAEVQFGYQLGYGSTENGSPLFTTYETSFQGASNWDSFTWDLFVWDGTTLIPTEVDVTGDGENIQVSLSSQHDYIAPFTINSIIYHYTPRRGLR